MEKPCFKCKRVLPLDQFYRHPAMPDGHVNKCIECNKADVRANRAAKLDYYHQYDRRRFQEQPQRKLAHKQRTRFLIAAGDLRPKARQAVGNAIRCGRLVRKPCEVCSTTKRVQAHHDDYSKPLDVRWFCFKHHREVAHGQIVTFSF